MGPTSRPVPDRVTFNSLAISQYLGEDIVGVRFRVEDGKIYVAALETEAKDALPLLVRLFCGGREIGKQVKIEGWVRECLAAALERLGDVYSHPFFLIKHQEGSEWFELEHYARGNPPRLYANARVWFTNTSEPKSRRGGFRQKSFKSGECKTTKTMTVVMMMFRRAN